MPAPIKINSGTITSMLQHGGSGGLGSDDGFLVEDWAFRNCIPFGEMFPTFSFVENCLAGNLDAAAAWQKEFPCILSFLFGSAFSNGGGFGGLCGLISAKDLRPWSPEEMAGIWEKGMEILRSLGDDSMYDDGDGDGGESMQGEYDDHMGWYSNAGGRVMDGMSQQREDFEMDHQFHSNNFDEHRQSHGFGMGNDL